MKNPYNNYMTKLYYTWADIESMMAEISTSITIKTEYKPDVIFGPGRGGYPNWSDVESLLRCSFMDLNGKPRDGDVQDPEQLKALLSKYFSSYNIVIIDDINDTGRTLNGIHDVVCSEGLNECVIMCHCWKRCPVIRAHKFVQKN